MGQEKTHKDSISLTKKPKKINQRTGKDAI